ncbi:Ras-related protein Rab-26 [Portunus trituberculatus]|uniref:Ras-related protein Rab-26 n=1 Tax=Portunus trituberculatus TaxID=210409 RepID=A0A5B7GIE8_PORTR|nr:Ras-related protein Rab-26 [Portunus trituberculatus]
MLNLGSFPACYFGRKGASYEPSNMIDMEDEREVRREDAAALAKFYNISYIETSSMRGVNVEEAFRTITQEVYDKKGS